MENLNEKIVLDFYLEQIEKDNIEFLKNKNKYKQAIGGLVLELRDEDNMHNKIEISKKLWKILFEAAMSHIDHDKRGYDDLFKFFDKYVNFEELIFASDSFYRDHTLHCLWVYFLGEYIARHKEFSFMLENMYKEENRLIKFLSILEECNEYDIFTLFISILKQVINVKANDSIRCISALTHDLGYPIKKISKINKCIKEILPHFSINNYDEFNFNYTEIQQNFIDDLINFISIEFSVNNNVVVDNIDTKNLIGKIFEHIEDEQLFKVNHDELLKVTESEKLILKKMFDMTPYIKNNVSNRMRYFNDFEQYNHGIMSAYLLMKTVSSFSKLKLIYVDYANVLLRDIDVCDIITKQSILKAITDHTSNVYQIRSIEDHSSFLTLIDELEEFSRISRANQNRQYINEFCKTNIYTEDGVLRIDFTFDNVKIDNLDPERAFKARCHRFLSLFDITDMDENLKIKLRCIGKLPYDNNIYELEIRRKFANIAVNDVEQDIPTYLKSNQFYSKEEYINM